MDYFGVGNSTTFPSQTIAVMSGMRLPDRLSDRKCGDVMEAPSRRLRVILRVLEPVKVTDEMGWYQSHYWLETLLKRVVNRDIISATFHEKYPSIEIETYPFIARYMKNCFKILSVRDSDLSYIGILIKFLSKESF